MEKRQKVQLLLTNIYGPERGRQAFEKLRPHLEETPQKPFAEKGFFSEKDVVLITYGDTIQENGKAPISALHEFANRYLKTAVSTIHFLPFFPFSSDDGFSVIDFYQINPELGGWDDVSTVGQDFRLMFDFVINHISSQSEWFRNYLEGRQGFHDLAIEVNPETDLSAVTRPRSLPLLTTYEKKNGETAHVWTTFSADQIDLNYDSLDVLEKMIEILLFYVRKGASILRLDAIAYLWKEIGTTCIHLRQTHDMVKLFRSVLDIASPDVVLLTETNVPHNENISYFGNGRDEAQMVYNFTLPPLLLYTFARQDASALSEWAKTLALPEETTTFFNFTASHDGIGVRPLEGILPPDEIEMLVTIAKENGGNVSYKRNPDGTESHYELNITYVDAILADRKSENAQKFLASQSIQYALPGVPATYIHSLLGSRNWYEGVEQTGRARTINRQKLNLTEVLAELENPDSFRSKVFFPYLKMMEIRRRQKAFHPNAPFSILDIDPRLFAIQRGQEGQSLCAITNISAETVEVSLDNHKIELRHDLLTGSTLPSAELKLKPYQFVWLSS